MKGIKLSCILNGNLNRWTLVKWTVESHNISMSVQMKILVVSKRERKASKLQ